MEAYLAIHANQLKENPFLNWVLKSLVWSKISFKFMLLTLYSYTKAEQGWRYVADRTGIVCFGNIPFIWLFAGRNNFFLWMTGWSFSTFNIFHRHIAMIATLQAIIHSVCYTVLEHSGKMSHQKLYCQTDHLLEGYLAESWTENYFYMGGIVCEIFTSRFNSRFNSRL